MREESLAQFVDRKGGWKVGEREREKAQRVLERQLVRLEGQNLGAHCDLVPDFSVSGVTMLQEKHAIVSFQVVEDGYDISVVSILVQSYLF